MMLKTFSRTVDVLVAFTIWLAAIFLTILTLHVLVIGALTVYHLMHS